MIIKDGKIYAGTAADGVWKRPVSEIVPVELISFKAFYSEGNVILNWSTASEMNNSSFEVQRKINNENWMIVGQRSGNGTTIEKKFYSFTDNINNISVDKISYRLKQIDFNGKSKFSSEVLVDNLIPSHYSLEQNYPNPFNPSTTIKYSLPDDANVRIEIFNALGEKCADLVNGYLKAGNHEVKFEPKNLSSGIYYYSLHANTSDGIKNYNAVKKLILLK